MVLQFLTGVALAYPRPATVPYRWELAFEPGDFRLFIDPIDDVPYWYFHYTVTNRTGHKLPSSYPSRRAWIRVQVTRAGTVLFDSGAHDDDGRIVGPKDESRVPHADVITTQESVVIYEARPVDGAGAIALAAAALGEAGGLAGACPAAVAPAEVGKDRAAWRPIFNRIIFAIRNT